MAARRVLLAVIFPGALCPIEVIRPNPDAIAHYLLPPRWVGTTPEWAKPGQEPTALKAPQLSELAEVVADRDLSEGVRCRVFRDGEITFALGDRQPSNLTDFERWRVHGVRLINAHLACLHTAAPPFFTASVATPWKVMEVEFASGQLTSMQPLDDMSTVSLAMARRSQPTVDVLDWRYFRLAPTVTIQTVERSLDLFDALLARPARDAVLLRAELLVRAKVALLENDFSGALTNAWTAAEGMLGGLLRRYLETERNRPSGDDEADKRLRFINNDRLNWLAGKDMTVRHTMEFLSLLGVLPFDLYRDARRSSTVRNLWLHGEKEPTYDDSEIAIRLAGSLFELLEGIALHVLGTGRPVDMTDLGAQ